MPPPNTVGRWLKTAFWRIFLLCHFSDASERRTWNTNERESMSLACFPHFFLSFFLFSSFCFSRIHFILWCCRTMHFQHPIKFHNHHLLVSRALAPPFGADKHVKSVKILPTGFSFSLRLSLSRSYSKAHRVSFPRFCFVFFFSRQFICLDIVRSPNRVLICKCLLGWRWAKEQKLHYSTQIKATTNWFGSSLCFRISPGPGECVLGELASVYLPIKIIDTRATECNTSTQTVKLNFVLSTDASLPSARSSFFLHRRDGAECESMVIRQKACRI